MKLRNKAKWEPNHGSLKPVKNSGYQNSKTDDTPWNP